MDCSLKFDYMKKELLVIVYVRRLTSYMPGNGFSPVMAEIYISQVSQKQLNRILLSII